MRKTLLPFSPSPYPLTIDISLSANSSQFSITYILEGAIGNIQGLDKKIIQSTRADELWKSTCFEWFLRSPSVTNYWEFNASPEGHWNFYSLDDYRTNLQASPLLNQTDIRFSSRPKSQSEYEFQLELNIESLLNHQKDLRTSGLFGITAVIQWRSGQISYFSLKHPLEKPDFHSKEGFIIPMSEVYK